MLLRIKSLKFKEDQGTASADQAVREGQGLVLHLEVDDEVFGVLNMFGDQTSGFIVASTHADHKPDTLVVDYALPTTEVTEPRFPHAVEGTTTLHLPMILAANPHTADELYLRIGALWLSLRTRDIADTGVAHAWREFCAALTARNQMFGGNIAVGAFRFAFLEHGEDLAVDLDAVMSRRTGIFRSRNFARSGPRLRAVGAVSLRVPTAEYAKDALVGIVRGKFEPAEGEDGVYTQVGSTRIRVDCDDAIGFGALRAIEILATHGPAAMQTFLALMGLWFENNAGAGHETYLTVRASDLMRYMNRTQVSGGGYNTEDQLQKGSEVFLLGRVMVPKPKLTQYRGSGISVETVILDRLLHLQYSEFERTLKDGKEILSILEFRYHPNRDIYEMLLEGSSWFAEVSGKLLSYHPVKHKYRIVIGFGLAVYDSATRRQGNSERRIGLGDLLRLVGIEMPKRNPGRFLKQITKAITKLGEDGVYPGVSLAIPTSKTMTPHQLIEKAYVTFPAFAVNRPLPPAPAGLTDSRRSALASTQ